VLYLGSLENAAGAAPSGLRSANKGCSNYPTVLRELKHTAKVASGNLMGPEPKNDMRI
jgi:hypothetical protein